MDAAWLSEARSVRRVKRAGQVTQKVITFTQVIGTNIAS